MITREQLADLQPGDVVEFGYDEYPDTVTRGPVRLQSDGRMWVARTVIRDADGHVSWNGYLRLLTVVSRAPRPLYVNHPRTEPVPGDVVRDADRPDRSRVWVHLPHIAWPREPWICQSGNEPIRRSRGTLPTRLRLLVDGETGQVVP